MREPPLKFERSAFRNVWMRRDSVFSDPQQTIVLNISAFSDEVFWEMHAQALAEASARRGKEGRLRGVLPAATVLKPI